MRSGPGRLPGRDVYLAGTFTGLGRLPGRDVYLAGTFTGLGVYRLAFILNFADGQLFTGIAETFVLLVPRKY